MRIIQWITFKKLSLVLYAIAFFKPILGFTNAVYSAPIQEMLGYEGLLSGWSVPITFLPWATNIIYFLIVFNRIKLSWIRIVLSIVNIILAFLLFNFDYYTEIGSGWFRGHKTDYYVEVAHGFYFWIACYIALLFELVKIKFPIHLWIKRSWKQFIIYFPPKKSPTCDSLPNREP